MIARARWILAALCIAGVTSGLQADETTDIQLKDLKLSVPNSWTKEKPSSSMRLTQFSIPAVEGESEAAEMAVFSFGGGGDVDANIKRWIDQFQAKGREAKVTQGKSEQGQYYFVEVSGTYNKPDGPPVLRKTKPTPGQRMLSVMLISKQDTVYFLKMTGPTKTVAKAAGPFRKSFGASADKEEAYSK